MIVFYIMLWILMTVLQAFHELKQLTVIASTICHQNITTYYRQFPNLFNQNSPIWFQLYFFYFLFHKRDFNFAIDQHNNWINHLYKRTNHKSYEGTCIVHCYLCYLITQVLNWLLFVLTFVFPTFLLPLKVSRWGVCSTDIWWLKFWWGNDHWKWGACATQCWSRNCPGKHHTEGNSS